MAEHFAFAAFVFALCIAVALYHYLILPKPKTREQLRREWEAARDHHKASRDVHRLYVKATAEQIKRECA